MGLLAESKVNVEDFNERLETKAEKQMLINGLHNKINKTDVESIYNSKIQELTKEFEGLLGQLDRKVDTEISNLNEQLGKKSNQDDIQYYRKELAFKLDKADLETFRQEYVDRVSSLDFKLNEKNSVM